MAINACSINAFTIDAIRCRRPDLFPPEPTVGTGNRIVRDSFAERFPQLFRPEQLEQEPQLKFEQPFITVSAELLGDVGAQTLEAKVQMEFATVTDLKIGDPSSPQDISVNISDFSI